MSGEPQLTLDGREIPTEDVATRSSSTGLNPAQREILAHLHRHGSIRPVDAGRIVHAARGPGRSKRAHWSSDGHQALKRLAARGLVQPPVEPGRPWERRP